jgi:hypothetical protein
VVLNPQKGKEEVEEEEKQQKDKVVVMVGADGRSFSQPEGDAKMSTTSDDSPTFTDKSFGQPPYQSQKEQEQEQERHEIPSQLTVTSIVAGKKIIAEGASFEHFNDNDKDIMSFEFPINRRDLQNYLDSVDHDNIWLNGKINTRTKTIIHSFGRLNQQNVEGKSSSKNIAPVYPETGRENGQNSF